MMIVRFLALVLILNVLRYAGGAIFELTLILPGLSEVMENNPSYFHTSFDTVDWVTSYFYNFVMWLVCVWVFHLMRPVLNGSDTLASFQVFGIQCLFFAAVSAIYMNHYSHPRTFYLWNISDAVLVYSIVALGNGLLYRRLMGPHASPSTARSAQRHSRR